MVDDTTSYVEGIQSVAVGAGNRLYGNWSFIGGKDNISFGRRNLTFGGKNIIGLPSDQETYLDTVTFGVNNVNRGKQALVVGSTNTNLATQSIIGGYSNNSTVSQGLVIGQNNTVRASNRSVVLGRDNILGYGSDSTFIFGASNETGNTVSNSFIVGENNTLLENQTAYLIGKNLKLGSACPGSLHVGHHNTGNSGVLFSVGCGTESKTAESFEVYDRTKSSYGFWGYGTSGNSGNFEVRGNLTATQTSTLANNLQVTTNWASLKTGGTISGNLEINGTCMIGDQSKVTCTKLYNNASILRISNTDVQVDKSLSVNESPTSQTHAVRLNEIMLYPKLYMLRTPKEITTNIKKVYSLRKSQGGQDYWELPKTITEIEVTKNQSSYSICISGLTNFSRVSTTIDGAYNNNSTVYNKINVLDFIYSLDNNMYLAPVSSVEELATDIIKIDYYYNDATWLLTNIQIDCQYLAEGSTKFENLLIELGSVYGTGTASYNYNQNRLTCTGSEYLYLKDNRFLQFTPNIHLDVEALGGTPLIPYTF